MSFNFRDKKLRASKIVALLGKKKTFGNKAQLDVDKIEYVFDFGNLSPKIKQEIKEANPNVL